MNRGNRKAPIFDDDQDRRQFLRTLVREQDVHGVKLIAGCLIDNHFHLGVVTPNGNLSDFMEQLEGNFARYYNRRHHQVGHLFQGRYRRVRIEDDIQLLTAACYIFMNPVAAGLARELHHYKWSTFAATAGFRPVPPFLSLDWLETLLPSDSLEESQRRFRELMSHPHPVVAYCQGGDELNVSPEVIKHVIRSYTGGQLRIASVPRAYRGALRPPIDELFQAEDVDRGQMIVEARRFYGYKNAEIAKALGMHPCTTSKMFCDRFRHHTSSEARPK